MNLKKVRILLLVSLLLAPVIYGTSIADSNKVLIPDVLGKTIEQAKLTLQQHDLMLGNVTEQETHHPAGTILVQAPRAQKLVPKGSPIRLIVAIPRKQANKTTVPALQGLSFQAAKAAIQKANLIIGTTKKREKAIEEEIVLYQSPPANSQLIIGSKINIILSEPIPLTGPRVKLLLDKQQLAIGEAITFKANVLNPPMDEVPVFSFTIDRKLHKTNIPEYTHKFTTAGKHNVIASVRYSRNPWIASLTRTVMVNTGSNPPVASTNNNSQNNASSDKGSSKVKPSIIVGKTNKPISTSQTTHTIPNNTVKLVSEKKQLNVGETTQLSIHLDENIATDNLQYAFNINGNTHYTKKPEYSLLLSKQGKYIITASVRHKREHWVASTPIAINAKLNHSGLSSNSFSTNKTISGTRVKTILDKYTYHVGETINLTMDACNVPSNLKPRYSFTIDRKAHYLSKPSFKHTFKQPGKYIITASIRYGRQAWIPSLSKVVNIIPTNNKHINKDLKMPIQYKENYKTTPNLIGLSSKQALIEIRKKGFRGSVIDGRKSGKILSQSPAPYSCATAKTKIKLSTTAKQSKQQYTSILATQPRVEIAQVKKSIKISKDISEKKPQKTSTDKPQILVKNISNSKKTPVDSMPVETKAKTADQLNEADYISALNSYTKQDNNTEATPHTKRNNNTETTSHTDQDNTNTETTSHTEQDNTSTETIIHTEQDIINAENLSFEELAAKETEENISELAAIYYSLEAAKWYEAESKETNVSVVQTKELQDDEDKSVLKTKVAETKISRKIYDNSMDKIYLLSSRQHIFVGNPVDFTLTRTIAEFSSTYHIVFHEDGQILPANNSKLSYLFNNWGIQSVYAEAETAHGITKSKMIKIWVWPKWSPIVLLAIGVILFLFFVFRSVRKSSPRKN